MPTLRNALLPVADQLRQLPPTFELRRFSVTIRRRIWSGSQPGDGTATDNDLVLTPAPMVRDAFPTGKLSPEELEYTIANNNIVTGQLYKISRITPRYTNVDGSTGGYLAEQLRLWPNRDSRHVENLIVLVGDDGYLRECMQLTFEQYRAFGYSMIAKEQDRPRTLLQSIALTPSPASVAVGKTLAMTATGTFNGGAMSQLTTLCAWSSSAPAVATVDIYGVVTGVGAGTATITATMLGIVGTISVTVA